MIIAIIGVIVILIMARLINKQFAGSSDSAIFEYKSGGNIIQKTITDQSFEAGPLKITISTVTVTPPTFTGNKTYADILAAHNSGRDVWCIAAWNGAIYRLDTYDSSLVSPVFIFSRTYATEDEEYQDWHYETFEVNSIDVWSHKDIMLRNTI